MPGAPFTFIDLFSGIGGFHAVLSALGGECVYASEINPAAAKVYELNWGLSPLGDLTQAANESGVIVPAHDVLCAGFPCQPFSKSGNQRGMEETRGTLYWNILRIIHEHHPKLVVLENVRNLAGPRHRHEWDVIIQTLREAGYRVSSTPAIFSPHLLSPRLGGRPQIRERVYIVATYCGPDAPQEALQSSPATRRLPVEGWDPSRWALAEDLPIERHITDAGGYALTEQEEFWLEAWDAFLGLIRSSSATARVPSFPIWTESWRVDLNAEMRVSIPDWKLRIVEKNQAFYAEHKSHLDAWIDAWGLFSDRFPASRRKFEWQAQGANSLWDTIIQFRPSGIRAKVATYAPALVAITQTSIIGSERRRLTPREVARLQGLPDWFDFGAQPTSATYRQLGNGISIGALWHVLKEHVARDADLLMDSAPLLLRAVESAPDSPDTLLERAPHLRESTRG